MTFCQGSVQFCKEQFVFRNILLMQSKSYDKLHSFGISNKFQVPVFRWWATFPETLKTIKNTRDS